MTIFVLVACVNTTVAIDGTYRSNEVDGAEIKIEEDKVTVISDVYDGTVSITADLIGENAEDSENIFYSIDQDALSLERSDTTIVSGFRERDEYVKYIEHRALLSGYNQDFIDMHLDFFDSFVFTNDNGQNKMRYNYEDMKTFFEKYNYLENYSYETEEIILYVRELIDYIFEYSQKFEMEAVVKDDEVKALNLPFRPDYLQYEGNYTFFRK